MAPPRCLSLPLYPMHYPRGMHFASFHLLWLMPLTHSLSPSLLICLVSHRHRRYRRWIRNRAICPLLRRCCTPPASSASNSFPSPLPLQTLSLDQKLSHLPLLPLLFLLYPPLPPMPLPLPAAPADIVAGSEAEPFAPAAPAAPAEEAAEAPALVWSRQLLARIRDKVGWSDALTWLQVWGGGIVGRKGGGRTIAAIHF